MKRFDSPGAGDFDYEALGAQYRDQRRADPRIARLIHDALGSAGTVLNVGAGTGSYEPEDRHVLPIEPSANMRARRPADRPPAIAGYAEQLPLGDRSVDASMAIATVHQWSNLTKGLSELRRVTRGPIIILTFDGAALRRYWLADYVPELMDHEARRCPSIETIRSALGSETRVSMVPVPADCTDGFMEAYYGRPERFLEADVRRAQSAWGFAAPEVEDRFVDTLSRDLQNGAWDRRYGCLRTLPCFEGSLRLIIRL